MPPSELVKLSSAEEDLASAILKQRKISISESVPEDIDARECLANIKSCTSALRKLNGATSLIGAYLGRHMAIMARRPEIFEAAGYTSLDEYEKAEILDKIGHGTVWNYKAVSEAFPSIELGRITKIRTGNLIRAAKVCKDASDSQKAKVLDKAEELPLKEFKVWIEEKSGLSGKGATSGASFPLMGSEEQISELKEFLADKRFRAFAETDQPVAMLLAAIKDSASDWPLLDDDEPVHDGQEPQEGGW